jgi:hypothetical protein
LVADRGRPSTEEKRPVYPVGDLRSLAPIPYAARSGARTRDMSIREASPPGQYPTLPVGSDRHTPSASRESGPLAPAKGGDLPIDRERREELRDLRGAHLGRLPVVLTRAEVRGPFGLEGEAHIAVGTK